MFKLKCILQVHQNEFNTNAALLELYKYAQKYNEEVSVQNFFCNQIYTIGYKVHTGLLELIRAP